MEKLSLARQTILGCLLAAALLSTLAAAGPARAGAARQPLQRHSGSRHSGPGRRRAAEHRPGAAEHRPVTAVVRRPTSAVPVRYEAAGVLPRMRVLTAPGFDTCSAPAASTMQAWYAESAYRAVGIYIGGRNRACLGGNLTSSWVSTVSAQGWGLFPVYVGLQAPCVIEKGMALMQSAQAAQEGAAEADDAATQAASYGLAKGSPVYFDLEAFTETDQGCVTAVLAYLNAWNRELHANGYYAGVYGSAESGMATLADAVQAQSSFTPPDAIWIARWDQRATTEDPSVPDRLWHGHQRMKQYQGGHVEKYGGNAVTIDSDYLDGPVARLQ